MVAVASFRTSRIKREERGASPLLFRVMIIRATTAVLIIRVMMDRFRTEGMYPNNT